jgi:hypothetical protein
MGIEIGSKGIKMSVLEVDNIKKGDYTVKSFWTENIERKRDCKRR